MTKMFVAALVFLLPHVTSFADGLSPTGTNAVVWTLLKPMLARWSYDPANGRVLGGPQMELSQSAFFAERQGFASEDLRACFDWYLSNLTNTVNNSFVRRNPMAVAAVEQCRAMSYTNAIPALVQFVDGSPDPAQVPALILLLEWKELDASLLTQVNRYLSTDSPIRFRDREVLINAFARKLTCSTASSSLESGVDVLYSLRTSRYGALTVDRTLVDIKPGYSNSIERYDAACQILSAPNISNMIREHFINVSNCLESVSR